ncbi:hypothetical protein GA0115260_1063011, partial [Streptomyces sp. MnatMP-M27]
MVRMGGWVVRITLVAPAVNAALRQVRFD